VFAAFWGDCSAPGLSEQGVEHFADEALFGFGQSLHTFELLLQLGRRPALAGLGRFGDERFDADAEGLRDHGQGRDLDASPPDFIGGDGLLGDAERLGQLHLGDAVFLAQLGDAGPETSEEGEFVGADLKLTHRAD
jgi:hypothetical protein